MLNAKQAVIIAKQKAAEILDQAPSKLSLAELERESYKGHDVWSITLRLPCDLKPLTPLEQLAAERWEYKRFLIDVETGELVALKLREVA